MIDVNTINKVDLITILCQDSVDNCPVIPAHVTHVHWGFDDPAKATGTEADIWASFERVRDEIKQKIKQFAETKYE